MKKRYYFLGFLFFLFYGCDCASRSDDPKPKAEKIITIINRTDKEYKENFLRSVCVLKYKFDGKWKLYYDESISKIKIGPKETVKKYEWNKKSYPLVIYGSGCTDRNIYKQELFLLSLDGGKRKIFFGAHDYDYKRFWGETKGDCKVYFRTYDIHPVWQEKELTIHIYNDKITFSDPKIKEVKKLKLTISGKKPEEVDPNTLPLVEN